MPARCKKAKNTQKTVSRIVPEVQEYHTLIGVHVFL